MSGRGEAWSLSRHRVRLIDVGLWLSACHMDTAKALATARRRWPEIDAADLSEAAEIVRARRKAIRNDR